MADKESLTGIETEVQIEERTRHAMQNYFNWLHNAILASERLLLKGETHKKSSNKRGDDHYRHKLCTSNKTPVRL